MPSIFRHHGIARLAAAQAAIEEKRRATKPAALATGAAGFLQGLAACGREDYSQRMNGYAATLEALERLGVEEQESVLEIMRRRLAERRRAELIATVKQARRELAGGGVKPASVAAIMRRVKP
jgi:hypothetical protein